IVATVTVMIFLRLESWPARAARQSSAELERLGKDLRSAFVEIAHLQPRITINSRVYMEQTTPVSELVVLSRRIEVEHELLHTWVGSSKRVKLHGTFNAKAGFDLQQNLSIDIRPDEIIVQLPHAQILGVEQEQVEVLAYENGLWNRISGQDLQSELLILPQLASKKAAETGLPAEAERTLQRQLDQRIRTPQPVDLVGGKAGGLRCQHRQSRRVISASGCDSAASPEKRAGQRVSRRSNRHRRERWSQFQTCPAAHARPHYSQPFNSRTTCGAAPHQSESAGDNPARPCAAAAIAASESQQRQPGC